MSYAQSRQTLPDSPISNLSLASMPSHKAQHTKIVVQYKPKPHMVHLLLDPTQRAGRNLLVEAVIVVIIGYIYLEP